jgi:hypothetical protein
MRAAAIRQRTKLMRINKLGITNKKATVILGAGASRGAKCFENSILPAPLDADFFALMQRVQHKEKSLSKFLEFLRAEFGEGSCPRMEELFTQLEALDEFHQDLQIQRGPKVRKYEQQLKQFVETTATFFRHLFVDGTGKRLACDYHDSLAQALNADDTIISFNYDCLMDEALARHGGRSWNVTTGYGLNVTGNLGPWDSTVSGPGRRAANPIRLLKLHGSLNWKRTNHARPTPTTIRLRADPYVATNRNRTEIVPPVWDKTIGGDEVFRALWKEARRILPTGPILVVIGYSVPPTDLLSQALIRVAASERASNQKLSHLIIVNPDADSRARFIALVKAGLANDTTVVELKFFSELKALLS